MQYVGLVSDLNSRMAQMPPLFDKNQQLDESELVDSLTKKVPRIRKHIWELPVLCYHSIRGNYHYLIGKIGRASYCKVY